MNLQFLQQFSEHDLITYIINLDTNKFYVFESGRIDNSTVYEINKDPRIIPEDILHQFDDIEDYDPELDLYKLEEIESFNMLSGEDDDLDTIAQFIESGCVPGKYNSRIKIEYVKIDPSPEMLMYWNHYQELDGKLIRKFDDYQYYYELFYMLTQNKVGSCCPVPSSIGFVQFENIIKAMCKDSGKKIRGSLEFTKFFRSIDDVSAYT